MPLTTRICIYKFIMTNKGTMILEVFFFLNFLGIRGIPAMYSGTHVDLLRSKVQPTNHSTTASLPKQNIGKGYGYIHGHTDLGVNWNGFVCC